MPLYHAKHLKEAKAIKPEVLAAVAHAFLKKIEDYSQEMIQKKWKALKKKNGRDPEALKKLLQWIQYSRFNQIAIEEVEDGTLDAWFKKLLK